VKPDIILLIIPVALIVLLTMQNRKRRRELQAAQNSLLLGSKVMTGAGMFGTVVGVDGDQVTLETGPRQTSVWLRQAIVRVVTPGPGDGPATDASPALRNDGPAAEGSDQEHPVKD
jgi:preprotein translocase subunit YajC